MRFDDQTTQQDLQSIGLSPALINTKFVPKFLKWSYINPNTFEQLHYEGKGRGLGLGLDNNSEERCNDIVCAIDFPDGWTGDTTLVR